MGKVPPVVKPNGKLLRAAGKAKALDELFHTSVTLNKRLKVPQREVIRAWFKENGMSTYHQFGEDGDVMWDDKWQVFHFKDPGNAFLFSLAWTHNDV
jgi:hypothetical protein